MTIHLDMMAPGVSTKWTPPQGTQFQAVLAFPGNLFLEGTTVWNSPYVGSDPATKGLNVTSDADTGIYYTNYDPVGPLDTSSMVVIHPWLLSWYCATRSNHATVDTLMSLGEGQQGVYQYSLLGAFSGTGAGKRCYALSATSTNPAADWILHLDRWTFPSTPDPTALTQTQILALGTVDWDTRLFLETINMGSFWRLIVMSVDHPDTTPWLYQLRGWIDDTADPIGPGMAASAALNFSGAGRIITRGLWVGGWGPDQTPYPIPLAETTTPQGLLQVQGQSRTNKRFRR